MSKHIAIIQGHPDARENHLGHALAGAYAKSAEEAGHIVSVINVARLEFPLLNSKEDFEQGMPPDSILQAQDIISRSEHLVIFYPLWLGAMPALLKGFLEQVFRPSFVGGEPETGKSWKRPLTGKSARIVVTMGMPVFVYRWYYFAHSLRSLERNILKFCGIKPVKESLFGLVEAVSDAKREKWLEQMRLLGRKGK